MSLYSKAKLSKNRKSLVIWTDTNTHGRSCGESRSEWAQVAEIPLIDIPNILSDLMSKPDGYETVL